MSPPRHPVKSASTPLLVDSVSLTRKNQSVRNSLAHNSRIQLSHEKNLAAFEREKKRAIHQLQNSKSYYDKTLKQMQDRQMEICKNREKERILIQAQSRYDKVPILETERFCGACSRRPQSAMVIPRVPVGPFSPAHPPCSCNNVSTSGLHGPRRSFVRRKTKSAGAVPSSSAPPLGLYNRFLQVESPGIMDDSRHLPTPVDLTASPRPVSTMRSFDSTVIPDSSAAKYELLSATRRKVIRKRK